MKKRAIYPLRRALTLLLAATLLLSMAYFVQTAKASEETDPAAEIKSAADAAVEALAEASMSANLTVEAVGDPISATLPASAAANVAAVVSVVAPDNTLDTSALTVMAVLNDDMTLTPVPTKVVGGIVLVVLRDDAILVPLSMTPNFTDISGVGGAGVQDEINIAASLGIINGIGGGLFAPSQSVTASQAVTMFMRAIGFPTSGNTIANANSDAGMVLTEGLDVDVAADVFSRTNTAGLIVNAMNELGMDYALAQPPDAILADFTDLSELTEQEREWFAVCVELGIFKGYGNGLMGAEDNLTRSQMASLAVRVQNLIMAGPLASPVLKDNYFDAILLGNSPFLTWGPVGGAVDFVVYVYDEDPDENPNAAPIKERLASSPVAPGIINQAQGRFNYEFDIEAPRFYLFANFFTENVNLREDYAAFRTEGYLPPGDYWFRVKALASDDSEFSDSPMSNTVGAFHSFYDPHTAKDLMEQGTPDEDFMLVSLRGLDEEAQQGQIKGQNSVYSDWFGYAADPDNPGSVMKSGVIPQEVLDWPKDKTIIVFCLGGNRSHNGAARLAEEGYTDVINIGGINQWAYGRDLSLTSNFLPAGPTDIANAYGKPLDLAIEGDELIYGSLVDNVTYNIFVFEDAEEVDPDNAAAAETDIPAYGFFTPTGVSPQTSLMEARFDLSAITADLDSGTYYIRVQAIDTRPIWGESSELSEPVIYTVG